MAPEPRPPAVVVTCEHATARVPSRFRAALEGRRGLLRTHRAFDEGALEAARRIARRLGSEVLAADVTRLLVDANRSEENPAVLGPAGRALDDRGRAALLSLHHRPHRARVVRAVERGIRARGRVVHVAVHSFTPVLRGRRRPMDVGLLLDPHRRGEVALVEAWRRELVARDARLRVARNRPYRGWTDGLATALRRRFPDAVYAGVELELNQRLARRPARWRRLADSAAEALEAAISDRR